MRARLWRLPPKSANTLHKHLPAEAFYFVLEGTGHLRVGDATLTVPRYGGMLVGPGQIFNDTDAEVLSLIHGAPEELEFLRGSKSQMDLSLIYPTAPTPSPINSPARSGRQRVETHAQPQAARIASAFTTCSGEPVKLKWNFPDRRVTRTFMESRPLAIIRKRSCLLISRNPCC